VNEHGCTVVLRDDGAKFDSIGSEHFGFQDGISQPGVRGRISEYDFLHRRVVDTDPDRLLYGLPGQFLVWPGEFVFGYPASGADPLVPGAVRREGPEWSRNGSYLVFRRLRQDVKGFWDWIAVSATRLRAQPGFENWSDDRVAAALVGRWKSGAPVSRTPTTDNEALGLDRLANNLFGFAKRSQPVSLLAAMTTANADWPEAEADPVGLICPQAAHIRKVNTRETPNDQGAGRSNLDRRILRHGIPYGRSYADTQDADEDRGLLFVSYQASIERQFEFLSTRWMNSSANPRSPGGHDLLVGQNGQPGENRRRSAILFGNPDGPSESPPVQQIDANTEFITPTGGGYFFSPSISAVHDILGTPS
jgi:Dyp-type peroxidase family